MKLRNKKTGEIATLTLSTNGEDMIIMGNALYAHITKLSELKDYEDYEEPKGFWSISGDATIEHYDRLSSLDHCKEIGNYFETKEEAELAVRKLKAWKRLKDKGFEFTNWEFRDVLDGDLVIEAKLNFDNASNIQRDLEVCFGGELVHK